MNTGAIERDGAVASPTDAAGAPAPAAGGAAFREVMQRLRRSQSQRDGASDGASGRAPGTVRAESGQKLSRGVNLRGTLGNRELQPKGRLEEGVIGTSSGSLVAFHVPPQVLVRPPPIARPAGLSVAAAQAAQSIADKVVQSAQLHASPTGKVEFSMQLRPEVLGGMEVRVRLEAGQVHVVFACQQPELRSTLESQTHLLRRSLTEQGLSVGEVAVSEQRPPRGDSGHGEPDDDADNPYARWRQRSGP